MKLMELVNIQIVVKMFYNKNNIIINDNHIILNYIIKNISYMFTRLML